MNRKAVIGMTGSILLIVATILVRTGMAGQGVRQS